jgi:hypothetical protein
MDEVKLGISLAAIAISLVSIALCVCTLARRR